mgnify:CR=1 FL=1
MLVKLCLSLHFIPLDPGPQTQMNADPTGYTSLSYYVDILSQDNLEDTRRALCELYDFKVFLVFHLPVDSTADNIASRAQAVLNLIFKGKEKSIYLFISPFVSLSYFPSLYSFLCLSIPLSFPHFTVTRAVAVLTLSLFLFLSF